MAITTKSSMRVNAALRFDFIFQNGSLTAAQKTALSNDKMEKCASAHADFLKWRETTASEAENSACFNIKRQGVRAGREEKLRRGRFAIETE